MSKVINYTVLSFSATPSPKDDRYYMSVSPKNPADVEMNPKGRFGFKYDQIAAIASNVGMDNPETLVKALNKGGCTISMTAELCKVGEEFTDLQGNVRRYGHNDDGSLKDGAKDWWKFDTISAVIDLSDAAIEFVDRIDERILVAVATGDIQRKRDAASTRRAATLARIAQMAGASTVLKISGRTADAVDDEEEVEVEGDTSTPPMTPAQKRAAAAAAAAK